MCVCFSILDMFDLNRNDRSYQRILFLFHLILYISRHILYSMYFEKFHVSQIVTAPKVTILER